MIALTKSARDWLADATGIKACRLSLAPMQGANSSVVFAVCDDQTPCFVVRVFDDADWLAQEPDLVPHEVAALEEAALMRVETPKIIASSATDIGLGGPSVLMSHLIGHVELQPNDLQNWITKLAQALVDIHAHKARDFGWRYQSWVDSSALRVPTWAAQPQLWELAFEFWRAGPLGEDSVFLHRDFHLCNVLWHDGKLSGVVDWVNACLGPRGVDVAHCRVNLAVLFGVEVADAFRDAYLERAGGAHHPYWDVDAILSVALPEPEFYSPWREFGLDVLSTPEMARRDEIYLQSVMEQVRD